jgi:cytochrome b subunit of formate dehydrogenase
MSNGARAYSQYRFSFHNYLIHFLIIWIITGLPMLSGSFGWIASIFGTPVSWFTDPVDSKRILSAGIEVARAAHRINALLFLCYVLVFFLVMLKDVAKWNIWPEKWAIDGTFGQVKKKVEHYASFGRIKLGIRPAERKAWIWFITTGLCVMAASGLTLMFRGSFSPDTVLFARLVHDSFFVLITLGVILHIH